MRQQELMTHDPETGEKEPYPSHAGQWREWHGEKAWLFNPWHGIKRHSLDIGSDPFGYGIVPDPSKPFLAAK